MECLATDIASFLHSLEIGILAWRIHSMHNGEINKQTNVLENIIEAVTTVQKDSYPDE